MNEGEQTSNVIRSKFGPEVLAVARNTPGEKLGRGSLKIYVEKASKFLEEKFALKLVELRPVNLTPGNLSPDRGEYLLVAQKFRHRGQLWLNAPRSAQEDFGIACFVIVMIILSKDGVSFGKILSAVSEAGLLESGLLCESTSEELSSQAIKPKLQASLRRLCSQRFLELVKATSTSEGDSRNQPEARDETDWIYYIGSYAREVIKQEDLKSIILKLYFPHERIGAPEFLEKHKHIIESVEHKLEASSLFRRT